MRKWYFIFRLAAYICSLSGLALVFFAHHRLEAGPAQTLLKTISGVLVGVGFISFLMTYGIYVYSRIFKD